MIIEKLRGIISTETVKHTFTTSVGTIANGVIGAFFYILAARILGPANFGLLSVGIATQSLLADTLDLGTSTGLVRFVGRDIVNSKEKAYRFLKLSLELKVVVWLVAFVVGWFSIPFIATNLFQKQELILPFRFSLLGLGGALLFSFSLYALQALQKFEKWGLLNVGTNTLRLGFTATLFLLGYASLNNILAVYALVPFAGFAVGLMLLPKFLSISKEGQVAKELLGYNGWVALFTTIAALSTRLDTFLVTRLLTFADLGIYSLANQLASIVSQITLAFGVVVAPKLSSMGSDKEAIEYLKKLQLFILALAVVGVAVGIPLSTVVIPFFYGQEYTQAILPFSVLLISQAIFLISIPVHISVIYYFAKPKVFVVVSSVHALLIASFGYVLISSYGLMGATATVLIGSISNFLLPTIWVLNKFAKNKQ